MPAGRTGSGMTVLGHIALFVGRIAAALVGGYVLGVLVAAPIMLLRSDAGQLPILTVLLAIPLCYLLSFRVVPFRGRRKR